MTTATDLAKHELTHPCSLSIYFELQPSTTVGQLIANSCAVGYGGHYDEALPDHQESEVLELLTDYLSYLYRITEDEARDLLNDVRQEWIDRLVEVTAGALEQWSDDGWEVDSE